MRLYLKLIYFIFIYLTSDNKWILVESAGSTANPNPGTGTQGGTAVTTPAPGATDSSNKTGIELSLKATTATDQFYYNRVGTTITYTTKGNNAFKSIKTGDIVVWETDKETEYATKVVLYGKGKKKKIVVIYFPNNTKKAFKRDGKGKPWEEVDPTNISAANQLDVWSLMGSWNYS